MAKGAVETIMSLYSSLCISDLASRRLRDGSVRRPECDPQDPHEKMWGRQTGGPVGLAGLPAYSTLAYSRPARPCLKIKDGWLPRNNTKAHLRPLDTHVQTHVHSQAHTHTRHMGSTHLRPRSIWLLLSARSTCAWQINTSPEELPALLSRIVEKIDHFIGALKACEKCPVATILISQKQFTH